MTKSMKHFRILPFPSSGSLADARLAGFKDEIHGKRRDFVLDYHELCLTGPLILLNYNGKPCEHVQGEYRSRRLRFTGVRWVVHTGVYDDISSLPHDHEARILLGVIPYAPVGSDAIYLFLTGSGEPGGLKLSAHATQDEEVSGSVEKVDFMRDWSSTPPLTPGLIPSPVLVQERFGGDPVTIHLGKRLFHRHLFVGGLDYQTDIRPSVGAVLNLSEEPSLWVKKSPPLPEDRWVCKGEGSHGMSVEDITTEARWVIDRLQQGERVLVHCQAGFNRSVTVICAVLILLEGLSAESALKRVREHHPWARPDAHHWLALKWLAYSSR